MRMIIAHITDTHILPIGDPAPKAAIRANALRRCVADIVRLAPDLVIHTGDATQHGDPEEYAHLQELLSDIKAPIYMTPGNRDEREAMRGACAHFPKSGEFLHYAVEAYPVRLVAFDTTGPHPRKGFACEERIDWFERTLAAAPDRPTIVFMHHPPLDIEALYENGYNDPAQAAALEGVIARHPHIIRVLFGHVHFSTCFDWAGSLASTMGSLAVDVRKGMDGSGRDDEPLYQVHTWDEAGAGSLTTQTRIPSP